LGPIFGLTRQDIQAIDAIIPQLFPPSEEAVSNGSQATIVYALQRWSWLVNDIDNEKAYTYTRQEYVADLGFRDFLEKLIAVCPPDLRSKLQAAVEPLDARFYKSTIEVDFPLTGSKEIFSKDEYPWYYRAPIRRSQKEFDVDSFKDSRP
jgi:hypothetical protein